jgi:hypothetical protein
MESYKDSYQQLHGRPGPHTPHLLTGLFQRAESNLLQPQIEIYFALCYDGYDDEVYVVSHHQRTHIGIAEKFTH